MIRDREAARARVEANFRKPEPRGNDAKTAKDAAVRELREKTERLREARLAKEARASKETSKSARWSSLSERPTHDKVEAVVRTARRFAMVSIVPFGKGKPHPLGFPFFRVRVDLALH